MAKQGKVRALLSASIMTMIGAGLLVGGTYALFSDTAKVTNHLQAGNLKISLLRTKLTKTNLDDDGFLKTSTDSTEKDFTGETTDNIFGLGENEVIVPQSTFIAEMCIKNGVKNGSTYTPSSVAFDYSVKIVLSEDADEDLSKQLTVKVTHGATVVVEDKKLSEVGSDALFSAVMTKTTAEDKFTVQLTFDDLVDTENNKAQNQKASFDLIVEAVQKVSA